MKLDRNQAENLLSRIHGRKVAVLGDLMLDEYLFGEVTRISPEAPVPIVRVLRERWVLGGAANVAANLKALGAQPLLMGTLQNDAAGNRLLGLLAKLDVGADGLLFEPTRPTIIKTRVIGLQQQMLRIDREEPGELEEAAVEGLCAAVDRVMDEAEALIVSDYAKGVIGEVVMERVRQGCLKRDIPWIVDPKPVHRDLYHGATLMTPNTKELIEMGGAQIRSDAEFFKAGRVLAEDLGLKGLLITRSEKGMALIAPEAGHRDPWIIPTQAREVYDVSGAGDTVIATFGAAVAAQADWKDAAMLANAAAGVVVAKVGTATATPAEILGAYRDQEAL